MILVLDAFTCVCKLSICTEEEEEVGGEKANAEEAREAREAREAGRRRRRRRRDIARNASDVTVALRIP